MEKINIFDSFLPDYQCKYIFDYCVSSSYNYGEVDFLNGPVTGMVHNIPFDHEVFETISHSISSNFDVVSNLNLMRMYVNCFSPYENPYFHIDGDDGITFLYYPQPGWQINDGGETQFYVNGELFGVLPLENRLVKFDVNILHRATSFRDRHRFTVAIKYK